MIQVDFNILNQKGSPALYQDTFASRPAASLAGRIFLATDTGNLYRDTGTTWVQIATGGGPGVTPGIDDVLAVGQKFTAARDIDCDNRDFLIQNAKTFIIENQSGNVFFEQSGNIVRFGDMSNSLNRTKLLLNDTLSEFKIVSGFPEVRGLFINFPTGQFILGELSQNCFNINSNQINTKCNGLDLGLNIDITNSDYYLGDYDNVSNSFSLKVNDGAPEMGFWNSNTNIYQGLYVQPAIVSLGDFNNVSNGIFLTINDPNYEMFTGYTGLSNGLLFNYLTSGGGPFYKFGDFDYRNGAGAGSIVISGGNADIRFNTQSLSFDDNTTGALVQGTSGATSGLHLKVTINGANYVIELKNP